MKMHISVLLVIVSALVTSTPARACSEAIVTTNDVQVAMYGRILVVEEGIDQYGPFSLALLQVEKYWEGALGSDEPARVVVVESRGRCGPAITSSSAKNDYLVYANRGERGFYQVAQAHNTSSFPGELAGLGEGLPVTGKK